MTETLQDLNRRIESARELHTVTRTMRGLAAVNLRGYELAAESTRAVDALMIMMTGASTRMARAKVMA